MCDFTGGGVTFYTYDISKGVYLMKNTDNLNPAKMKSVSKFYDDETRHKLYRKEFNKLRRICKTLDDDQKKVALPLCENLAFCVVMLKELREIINRDGYSEVYVNGKNQTGIKRTVASDLLIAIQKNYAMLLKQFKDLLPSTIQLDDMDAWERANSI